MAKRMTRKLKPAAKAAPRQKAPRPPVDMLGIIDRINNQIRFAEGIDLAVMGQADLNAFDSSAISQLIETHIEGLQSIAASFEKIRSAS